MGHFFDFFQPIHSLWWSIFGASLVLLTSRLEFRRDAADIYYRRTLWLLLFGVAHGYLLWLGDILYSYALCGLALYPFRKLPARKLLIIGLSLLIVSAGAPNLLRIDSGIGCAVTVTVMYSGGVAFQATVIFEVSKPAKP